MAHSKRNTSLPHFTSHERGLLRSTWGSQSGVIGRDSFLPFASCRLCLHPARPPVVACANSGDIFCRECAINDLLAQRQEIKRVEREREKARRRIAADEERTLEEAKGREVKEFEMSSMGLDENGGGQGRKRKADSDAMAAFKAREVEVDGKRKKVFELDEKEIARLKGEEQERLKEELKREKVLSFVGWDSAVLICQSESTKSGLRSFWLPSLTPTMDPNEIAANKAVKLAPICPGSTDTNRHSYSLKSLVEVHFTEEKASDGTISRVCPSCKKNLTNGLKAIRASPFYTMVES